MEKRSLRRTAWLGGLVCGLLAVVLPTITAPVFAHDEGLDNAPNANKQGKNVFNYTAPEGGVPADLASKVGIDQKLDARLPLNLEFKDETGKTVTLGEYYGRRPVMLSMIQFTCDQICSAQLEVMSASLNQMNFSAGKEFEILTVSIDPRESPLIAQDVKDERMKDYKRPTAKEGWHFLTGSEKNIKALAQAIGYKYIWHDASKQYIHPDGIVITTPDGRVSKYFMSLDYPPRDLKFAVMDASKEHVGSVVDQIALSCFHYNPETGKYSFQIMALLRVTGIAFVLGVLGAIFWMVRSEKKRGPNDSTGKPSVGGPQLKKA